MKKSEKEKEQEKDKGGRREERAADRKKKIRKDRMRFLSGGLSRAELGGVAAELGVGARPGVEEKGEKEREERGLAAWVVQMGGTRHK